MTVSTDEAVTVMASLDGVLTPMKDGGAVEKRAETAAHSKKPRFPVGEPSTNCAR